jgi:NADPH:quinone reductase-like Zn-dependent oxidoreductase
MKALVLNALKEDLKFETVNLPVPQSGEQLVAIKAAALNRRDYWITRGLYPEISLPVILGSDGAGLVDSREVVINPGLNWGLNPLIQGEDFEVLGLPRNGCFAEFVSVPEENIFPKPAHLSWEEAAALPLAGVTAYRALVTRGMAKKGDKLFITGIGGGVAMTALLFALALELKVFVSSGNQAKIDKAIELGASGGVNYKKDDWDKKLLDEAGTFDLIIDSAGGKPFSRLLKLCKPGGRIVSYGGTLGKVDDLSPQVIFWRQLNILGTTMGDSNDFASMLELCTSHGIRPVVDSVFPLEKGNDALRALGDYSPIGKIVLKIKS